MRKQVGLLLLATLNLAVLCFALVFVIVGFIVLVRSLDIASDGSLTMDTVKVFSIAALFGAGVVSTGIHLMLERLADSLETEEERRKRLEGED